MVGCIPHARPIFSHDPERSHHGSYRSRPVPQRQERGQSRMSRSVRGVSRRVRDVRRCVSRCERPRNVGDVHPLGPRLRRRVRGGCASDGARRLIRRRIVRRLRSRVRGVRGRMREARRTSRSLSSLRGSLSAMRRGMPTHGRESVVSTSNHRRCRRGRSRCGCVSGSRQACDDGRRTVVPAAAWLSSKTKSL